MPQKYVFGRETNADDDAYSQVRTGKNNIIFPNITTSCRKKVNLLFFFTKVPTGANHIKCYDFSTTSFFLFTSKVVEKNVL